MKSGIKHYRKDGKLLVWITFSNGVHRRKVWTPEEYRAFLAQHAEPKYKNPYAIE